MYYIILFLGVLTFLALVAWFLPSQRHKHAHATKFTQHGAARSDQAGHLGGDLVAQLLKGERKEDKPCITPIDCVMDKRCAGHCGCR